jgi:hypothetical protein
MLKAVLGRDGEQGGVDRADSLAVADRRPSRVRADAKRPLSPSEATGHPGNTRAWDPSPSA